MEEELPNKPQEVTNDEKQLWNGIWSMRVPPKLKTLLWRACQEAMLTKSALFRRTISIDSLCVRCHAHSEDSMHALWFCSELDSVWSNMELWSFQFLVQFVTFKELLSLLIKNNHQPELFAVTWTHRSSTHWRPPPFELFKINFDGAVFAHDKKSGIGVVIRDHQGLVIASCSKPVHQVLRSNDIEAKAAGWALSFALDVGVKRAVLEGDSLTVIKGLMEEESLLIPMGLLNEDAKQLS
ncbi:uncharacterized protein LOC112029338 [Quercus suber]|uniref:uncharacterized protein LOC112029338 n=1 Tax=Quercus suber TaxID=58331 RepID=UPI000CE1DD0E|nr:uncharacterized protein LOC112029338 [Quercus suber]